MLAMARIERQSALALSVGGVLFVSLVLGGGTRAGFFSDFLLQLLSLPLLAAIVARAIEPEAASEEQFAADPLVEPGQHLPLLPLAVCLGVIIVPLCQLIPLPPSIWTRLPGQMPLASGYSELGASLPWRPISATPHLTWLALLSVLPPVAIFVATARLGASSRSRIAGVLLACGLVSVLLGLLQIAQGPTSPLRFYLYTSNDVAVGFFANRNHLAALIYVSTLLAAAWIVDASARASAGPGALASAEGALPYLALLAAFLVVIALTVGQITTSSRAGVVLTMVALVGVYLVVVASGGARLLARHGRWLMAAVGLAVVIFSQLALWRLLERFGGDPLQDARLAFARQTTQAALSYLPFGSGVGSFVQVYAQNERREDLMIDAYANHAHNDVLQIMLEAGLPGAALLVAGLAWIGIASYRHWTRPPEHMSDFDRALARSAGIALMLLAVHSVLDYPLRTGAMMSVAAFLAALLVPPPRELSPLPQRPRPERVRQRPSGRRVAGPAPPLAPIGPRAASAPAAATSWPQEWGGSGAQPTQGRPRRSERDPSPR